tara:strand:+ start:2161 stop:2340 length:180 start_codon:yes stop_codon:yes gene_type:complete
MNKSIFKSKTFWLQVVTFASVFVPPVQAFIVASPESATAVIGAVNVLMRFISQGRVTLS